MSNYCLWSYYFYLFTQTSSWSLPTLLSLDTTMCLLFYFFTFKPVMLYWMRIKAKLTHIKYSRASFSFYYRIFCESSTIYICRKRPDNFSSPPPPKKILWKRCSFEFVWNVYEKKKQPLHRICICIRIWMNTATFLFIMQSQ